MNGSDGKVVIVTGGGKGIGAEYSMTLARSGHKIVVADIDGKAVEKTLEIMKSNGMDVLGVVVDITNQASVQNMVNQVVKHFGRINALINNAAIYAVLKKKSFLEIEEDEWTKVMDVNLKGIFLCCKAVVPEMKRLGKGSIVNISSSTAHAGVPGFLHYVSSKAGVIGFTRALAREIGQYGITVNAVAPGLTSTETNANLGEEYFKNLAAQRSIPRVQVPSDLAGAIAFLVSDSSSFITGQTLIVDGGISMI